MTREVDPLTQQVEWIKKRGLGGKAATNQGAIRQMVKALGDH